MPAKKVLLGSIGLLLLAMGAQLPVKAQTMLENLNPAAESAPTEAQTISSIRELAPEKLSASELSSSQLSISELTASELTAAASSTDGLSPDELSASTLTASEPAVGELAGSSYERPEIIAEATLGAAEPEAMQPENFSPKNLSADSLALDEGAEPVQPTADAVELTYPTDEAVEIAQERRRTRNAVRGSSDFIGIGADFGTADDISFAIISKLSLSDQIAVRPSVLIGNDFAVLVPVTYEFSRFTTNVQSFRILPYAGIGASYVDSDNSDFGLLLSAGVDVPVSRQFTANAQANYSGLFSDSDNFGVTIGVGYNFGGFR